MEYQPAVEWRRQNKITRAFQGRMFEARLRPHFRKFRQMVKGLKCSLQKIPRCRFVVGGDEIAGGDQSSSVSGEACHFIASNFRKCAPCVAGSWVWRASLQDQGFQFIGVAEGRAFGAVSPGDGIQQGQRLMNDLAFVRGPASPNVPLDDGFVIISTCITHVESVIYWQILSMRN